MTWKASAKKLIVATTFVALVAAPAVSSAAGNGKGHTSSTSANPCTVSGTVVSGTGLPTGEVINFMVTDASGTSGWVLGFTPDGTWTVNVPSPSGSTTYEFASRTFGPNGSKYTVFQSCSV